MLKGYIAENSLMLTGCTTQNNVSSRFNGVIMEDDTFEGKCINADGKRRLFFNLFFDTWLHMDVEKDSYPKKYEKTSLNKATV